MAIQLEAIKFNHNPKSSTVDALNIRRNGETNAVVPEWQRGTSINPEDSPAAYSIFDTHGNTLTIQAKFKRTDPKLKKAEVRAVEGSETRIQAGGCNLLLGRLLMPAPRTLQRGVLGLVDCRPVVFEGDDTDFETFTLSGTRLDETGVGINDIEWRWQYRLNPRDQWTDITTSRHRIYTLLRLPQDPWQPLSLDISNINLPWTEVLEYACRWATGARNQPDAASRITRSFYQLGGDIVQYESSCHYTEENSPDFFCTRFLADLHLGSVNVNCADCAIIVSTFANILGCELWQSRMSTFRYNPILKIGRTKWHSSNFVYHEVAWEDGCDENHDVYDACLQVDGDNDPTENDSNHTPLLPTNMRFGLPHERSYRYRLVAPENPGGRGQPRPRARRRRNISSKIVEKGVIADPMLVDSAKQLYGFNMWQEPSEAERSVSFRQFNLPTNALRGSTQLRIQRLDMTDETAFIESLWQPSNVEKNVRLRVEIYEGASSSDARSRLLLFLAGLHERDIEPPARKEFGEVSFHAPDYSTVIFARHNLAVTVRNAGRQSIQVNKVAELIDQQIINLSKPETFSKAHSMNRFKFSGTDYQVNTDIPLEIDAPDPLDGASLTYAFISDSSEVLMQNKRLVYRPVAVGEQRLRVFAINKDGSAFQQELQILVR